MSREQPDPTPGRRMARRRGGGPDRRPGRRWRLAWLALLGAVLVAAALARWWPGLAPVPAVHLEGIAGEPLGLNPLLFIDPPSQQVASLLFDGLTRLDPSGRVLPALATSWEPAPGNRSWTFRLRPDAAWHDGQPVTAGDVTFTINALALPDFPGEPGREWRGVRARHTGDLVVVIELPEPDAAFPVRATVPVLPRHILGNLAMRRWYEHGFSRQPVGSGPFRFLEWREGEHIRLGANQGYYLGAPALAEIVCRFYAGPGEVAPALGLGREAFRGGGAPPGGLVDPSAVASAVAARSLRVTSFPGPTLAVLVPNHRRPAGELAVRQAVAALLDRERLTRAAQDELVRLGLWTVPARGGLVPLLPDPGLNPAGTLAATGQEAPPARDPERSRRLLAAAGWRDTDGDGVLDRGGASLRPALLVPSDRPDLVAAARQIASQMAGVGVAVEVRPASLADYLAAWAPPFDFDWLLVELVSAPAQDYLELLHSAELPERGAQGILRGGANLGGISDPELDEVLTSLAATPWTDEAGLARRYEALNRRVAQMAHLLALWREAWFYASPAGLDGPAPGMHSLYWNVHQWRPHRAR